MLRKIPCWAVLTLAMILVISCSGPVTSPAVGPHPDGWRQTHGRTVQAAGGAVYATTPSGALCSSCHTLFKASDGTTAPNPGSHYSCYSCHEGPTGGGV